MVRSPATPGDSNHVAEISKLRLAGITFDSKTLRVVAEAEGAIDVHVSALPAL